MKKQYETPKVEKIEFNYSETVTASGCSPEVPLKYTLHQGDVTCKYVEDSEGEVTYNNVV